MMVEYGLLIVLKYPIGICIQGFTLLPPASIKATELRPFSDNRLANTHPAEPAPTIIKSNFILN